MTKSSQGETSSFVLESARAAGFQVNDGQLSGWHRDGLIPRPQQRWTEGIAGSQTVYPIGTAAQLCALCAIRSENRSSAMIWGWKLWWLGFPVDERYWRLKLKAQARLLDRSSLEFVRLLDSDQTDAQYKDAVTVLRTRRTRNTPFLQLRRRVVAGYFEGMLIFMTQILAGNFLRWSFAPSDDEDAIRDRMTIDRTFGLRRAKNVREVDRSPTMHGDIEDGLQLLSDQLGETKIESVLSATSDSQIVEARAQLRVILFTVNGAEETSGHLAGFGVRVLKELAQQMNPGEQATFLLYLLALRRSSAFQRDIAVFLHALRRHVPKSISNAQIEYLRSRDPIICSFAFPE